RWLKFGMDKEQGGFYEIIDTDDKPDPTIPKTALTVSGVLYNFSKAYINSKNAAHLAMAERAALYLKNFRDHTHGGVFNALKGNTEPEDSGKNTRTHARVLSALCAYYHCVPSQVVKDISVALYQRI